MTNPSCPFCQMLDDHCVALTQYTRVFRDQFPVSENHTLVIPRQHVTSIFDLHDNELEDLWKAVGQVREHLKNEFGAEAFNIGLNDGGAAGQTVKHAHVHVIPRYPGDVPDPRGGVRWVIPSKADYWTKPQ